MLVTLCMYEHSATITEDDVTGIMGTVYGLRVGRDNAIGIATCYGLDDPAAGARFSAPVQTGPVAHAASYTMGTGSFPEVKRPGRGVDHPHHLALRLKKEYSYTYTPPMGLRGLF
jgi:hypothetical protein